MSRHAHNRRPLFHPRDWKKGKCQPESPSFFKKIEGFIAFYDSKKGFGFIVTPAADCFFHVSDVANHQRAQIAEGVRIVCHVEPSELKGKMRARHVAIVNQD